MTCPACQQRLVEGAVYCNACGTSIRRQASPVRYAGFWRRVAAVILDLVIMCPAIVASIAAFTSLAVPGVDGKMWFETFAAEDHITLQTVKDASAFAFAIFLALAPYYIVTEISGWQATLGKRIVGLRVVDVNGNRIGLRRATVRYAARILSHAPWMLGFVMAGFTAKKQALHDIVAGTLVVAASKEEDLARCPSCGRGAAEDAVFCWACGARLRVDPISSRYAGFWARVLAVVIDVMFLALPVLLISAAFVQTPSAENRQVLEEARARGDWRIRPAYREAFAAHYQWAFSEGAVVFLIFGLYNTLTEASSLQGTFGKRVIGLRVVDLQGRRIGLRCAVARCGARMLSAFSWHIGFVITAFTPQKQALHDIVTGTLVVKNAASSPKDSAMIRPPTLPQRNLN